MYVAFSYIIFFNKFICSYLFFLLDWSFFHFSCFWEFFIIVSKFAVYKLIENILFHLLSMKV